MSDFAQWMASVVARTESALERALPAETVSPQRLHAAMRFATNIIKVTNGNRVGTEVVTHNSPYFLRASRIPTGNRNIQPVVGGCRCSCLTQASPVSPRNSTDFGELARYN